jgi:uncharacterized phage infection (PIP) family protein YhgE
LTLLTLAITVAVVGVVAAYLVQIAVALTRANNNLAKLAGGLEAIRNNTAPLAEDLGSINSAAVTVRDGLIAADGNLVKVIEAVRPSQG